MKKMDGVGGRSKGGQPRTIANKVEVAEEEEQERQGH